MKMSALISAFIAGIFSTILVCAFTRHQQSEGYILEHEQEIRVSEPGSHKGGGQTIAYPFFSKAPGLKLVFRKRTLLPGSSIGYHLQQADEIYYILSGSGEMTMNGKSFPVTAGDAILTRP